MGTEIPVNEPPEPPRLRQLRRLVNTLTVTLIAGFLVVVAALVIRLSRPPMLPVLPTAVQLPPGETAGAVTFGDGWVALVTTDGGGRQRLRLYDAPSGAERAVSEVAPTP